MTEAKPRQTICRVRSRYAPTGELAEDEANARLLATAPRLLADVIDAELFLTDVGRHGSSILSERAYRLRDQLRAAIAKATSSSLPESNNQSETKR